ncbi:hypothetical protein F4558_003563 [Micromonospora profundi]|nr:hypothetical protein [Micromonospora profundi]
MPGASRLRAHGATVLSNMDNVYVEYVRPGTTTGDAT